MCHDLSLTTDLKDIKPPLLVFLLDRSTHYVDKVGQVILHGVFSLTDVLHLPTFKYNLLPVNKLCTTSNVRFNFTSTSCHLQEAKTDRLVDIGRVLGTLYVINQSNYKDYKYHPIALNVQFSFSSKDVSPAFKPTVVAVHLWHQRFGHASFTILKHLSFLSNMLFANKSQCDICPLAKQQCLPFPSSSIHTLSPFELIHVGLWCPYHHESLSGARFMVTIVDDYSRVTWTYFK